METFLFILGFGIAVFFPAMFAIICIFLLLGFLIWCVWIVNPIAGAGCSAILIVHAVRSYKCYKLKNG